MQPLGIWKQLVRSCRLSGKSIKEFCEEQNLSTRRYFYWQRKLRAEQPEWFSALEAEYYRSRPNDAPLEIFLPVEIQAPAAVTTKNDQLTVELKSGHRILIPSSVSRETLSNLVAALENSNA